MPIFYARILDLAVYVAPKCGVTKLKQLTEPDNPYTTHNLLAQDQRIPKQPSSNLFEEIPDGKSIARVYHRLIVVRSHSHRVLSTYYDKIVDPSHHPEGWRSNHNSPFNEQTPYQGYSNFLEFVSALAWNAWDGHIQPYLAHPVSRAAATNDFSEGEEQIHQFVSTARLQDTLRVEINSKLGLSPSYGEEWWKTRTEHSIKYSSELPNSSQYGADEWSQVAYEDLYRCFKERGALPAPQLMYDDETLFRIQSQMGYACDQIYFSTYSLAAKSFFNGEGHLFRI